MTSYHGGKHHIGKHIAEVIVDESLDSGMKIKGYCEPFCGMLGVYRHIPLMLEDEIEEETGKFPKLQYKAGDLNESVIKMWKRTQNGWKPPTEISEKEWIKLKKGEGRLNGRKTRASALKGFAGHQFSFGGQYFKSFAPKYGKSKSSGVVASERVHDIGQELHDVKFTYGRYTQFSILKGYIIYCDPPYRNTTCNYKEGWDEKDDDKFWKWCKKMALNNLVFVSGYKKNKIVKSDVIYTKQNGMRVYEKTTKKLIFKKREEKLFMVN